MRSLFRVFATVLLALGAFACGGNVEIESRDSASDAGITATVSTSTSSSSAVTPTGQGGGSATSTVSTTTTSASTSSTTSAGGAGGGMTTSTTTDSTTTTTSGTGGAGGGEQDAGAPDAQGDDAGNDAGDPSPTKFSVTLGDDMTFGVYVKKEQSAFAVSVKVTTDSKPVSLHTLTLTGQTQITPNGCAFGQPCACKSFSDRVTSLRLEVWSNGWKQVGFGKVIDVGACTAKIDAMNFVVPANTTQVFRVMMTLSSSVSPQMPYDKVAVGIVDSLDIYATSLDGGGITWSLDGALQNQMSANPSIVKEIRPNGYLEIDAFKHPPADIMVAGTDQWQVFAQYVVSAMFEDIVIDRASIMSIGSGNYSVDPADLTAIAIAIGGNVLGQSVFPSWQVPLSETDIDLSMQPITITDGGSVLIQIVAKVAPVQPASFAPGEHNIARSGDMMGLGITNNSTNGEWDQNYVNRSNVRATGQTSGERIYTSPVLQGNSHQFRKSKPTVTKHALLSNTLFNGDADLLEFQVSANSAGPIAMKHVSLMVAKSQGVSLSNFRLRRGAVDLPLSAYSMKVLNGVVWSDGIGADVIDQVELSIDFTNEEMISGAGYVYSVHAQVDGVGSNNHVIVSFKHPANNGMLTGCLVADVSGFPFLVGLSERSFIWADISGVPHSDATCDQGGSSDWTGGTYVNDLWGIFEMLQS
ncbi:hypothetical protein KBC54_02855 [Patescibacteria group bacterium]|nr:hypothetical protein [Patescibacteria group bacterium]